MSSTLVDSNVLIDLFDEDSEWRDWSDAMLTRAANRGPLVINPIVFAEVSAGFDSLRLSNTATRSSGESFVFFTWAIRVSGSSWIPAEVASSIPRAMSSESCGSVRNFRSGSPMAAERAAACPAVACLQARRRRCPRLLLWT